MFGAEISIDECNLFALPLWFGRLGVSNPVPMAPSLLDSSVRGTVTLVRSIVGATTFEFDAHFEMVSNTRIYHQKHLIAVLVVLLVGDIMKFMMPLGT